MQYILVKNFYLSEYQVIVSTIFDITGRFYLL